MNDEIVGFSAADARELLELLRGKGQRVPLRRQGQILGGGGGSNIYRYTLTSDMTSNTATANIFKADGTTSVEASATVNDPLDYVPTQLSGDMGHCYKEGSAYYVLQAPCSNPCGS